MKNIFLVGFMGTGKSTIARRMKQKYRMEIIEMDELIEEREGMKIPELFQTYGEEYFRNLETELLSEIQAKENLVVSCGGGVVLREENVRKMKECGMVVLLTASPQTILKRVRNNNRRPLLEGKKTIEEIGKLMEARREAYERAADVSICVDDKNSEKICMEIIKRAKGLGKQNG